LKKPEILAPAGNLEKLRVAYMYGADACYMGMKSVSMRVKGSTLDVDEIEEALKISREMGKKLYLTMNIHAHQNKMNFVQLEIERLKELKAKDLIPDGLLISDPGMMMEVQKACPWIDIHLSTQANTLNASSCEFWAKLGVTRVVFGREINLREIKKIRQELDERGVNVELEAFVHGAMCMAYSGRCLLSNFMSNRDANEGMCAHSCRWNYKMHFKQFPISNDQFPNDLEARNSKLETNKVQNTACCSSDNDEDDDRLKMYLEEGERKGEFIPVYEDEEGTSIMSAKDMCMAEHMADVIDSGIDSAKIEGRHKTIFYAAIASRIYRQATDLAAEGRPLTNEIRDLIETINTRGYFTGFWYGKPGAEGQKYGNGRRGDYSQKYCFAGIIRKVDGETVEMEVKNTLFKGDRLDIITPTKNIPLTAKSFQDAANGEVIEAAHPGQKFTIRMKVPEQCESGWVVRKQLN
jgi:putative protease